MMELPEYSKEYAQPGVVTSALLKQGRRIERIRHRVEADAIKRYARGMFFDCTINIGRFIPEFSEVSEYHGMDISGEFVSHIRDNYPTASAKVGNLLDGIDESDDTFDSVLCLRTLFALTNLRFILNEMVRICRPGGYIIFDYGTTPKKGILNSRNHTMTSEDDPMAAISSLKVELIDTIVIDTILGIVKRFYYTQKFFNSPVNLLPDGTWATLDRKLSLFFAERNLFVLKKNT